MCSGRGHVNVTRYGSVFAGMPEVMSAAYLRMWGRHIPHAKDLVVVPCRSLTSLMEDNGMPTAEFLSLDAQGAELLVLNPVDPAAFKVIMIEMDVLDKLEEGRVHSLLLRSGCAKANASFRVSYSRVYVSNATSSLLV